MFNNRHLLILPIVMAALMFSGCATSRGIMPLSIPAATEAGETRNVTIYINSVTDQRVFEEKPDSPDIPSLGFGGAAAAAEDIKARAIARKRGGFGKAMGDILLPEDQTVASLTRQMLASALRSAGYAIADTAGTTGAVTLEVTINRYWGWLNLGAWALTITAHSDMDIKAIYPDGKSKTYKVFAKGSHRPQTGSTANWQKAFRLMMEDFTLKLGEALEKEPI